MRPSQKADMFFWAKNNATPLWTHGELMALHEELRILHEKGFQHVQVTTNFSSGGTCAAVLKKLLLSSYHRFFMSNALRTLLLMPY